MQTTSEDPALTTNYLAAAFSFPSTEKVGSDDVYIFGGMCPSTSGNASSWSSNAQYSNMLLAIQADKGDEYDVSLTGTRSPPIAEAGLTITPLKASSFAADNTATQQKFILLGGHTQEAFINMSQAAMYSMPDQAWAFVGINQPSSAVEPRSGHTAVLSNDGSKLYMLGGWVGSVSNPAIPQLAVLEIGAGYGGTGPWKWIIPSASQNSYPSTGHGLYGHAAIMLPGDIMMVTGGFDISNTKGASKRSTSQIRFYDTAAGTWSTSYSNPGANSSTTKATTGLTTKGKTGLGAGLGVGIAVAIVICLVALFWLRRKKQQRKVREQHLRDLAMGTNDAFSTVEISRPGSRGLFSGYRSASWGARQEERIEHPAPHCFSNDRSVHAQQDWTPERDVMLSVPGPEGNKSNSLRSRGPPSFGSQWPAGLPGPSGVFTIEEVEERSERGSIRRPETADSRPLSDPFKDPPHPVQDEAAQKRRLEVQTWVDDWQSAAESMTMSRSNSKAQSRTYSNLSAYHSAASSAEKSSDRTNSDLSERSNISNLSFQRSTGETLGRAPSTSNRAGYALFSSAAAAMSRMAGRAEISNVDRNNSKRVVSQGDLAQMAARRRGNSVGHDAAPPVLEIPRVRDESPQARFNNAPESPHKEPLMYSHTRKRSNSMTGHTDSFTSSSKKAFGALGQGAKRILTGTNNVSVGAKVDDFESRSRDTSPTKSDEPEMAEVSPRRVSSSGAAFWRHKQGAKDWGESSTDRSGTVRRRSGRPTNVETEIPDDDWDVEMAVQQRVVQVMFTVPKEKLRVVNADNLSLISRTDTNASRLSEKSDDAKDMNRMSKVMEDRDETIGSTEVPTTLLHPNSAKDKQRLERSPSQSSQVTIGR